MVKKKSHSSDRATSGGVSTADASAVPPKLDDSQVPPTFNTVKGTPQGADSTTMSKVQLEGALDNQQISGDEVSILKHAENADGPNIPDDVKNQAKGIGAHLRGMSDQVVDSWEKAGTGKRIAKGMGTAAGATLAVHGASGAVQDLSEGNYAEAAAHGAEAVAGVTTMAYSNGLEPHKMIAQAARRVFTKGR